MKSIVIGARASTLAQTQAQIVKDLLLAYDNSLKIEIKAYSTKGDQRLDINWKTSNESLKGLFTTELEQALLKNEIDIAVHSLKDMPAEIHYDLEISGFIDSRDERDVFVSTKYNSLDDLPPNAIVGTSALRREMQLKKLRDDLDIQVIRGNIETRLRKLEAGEYDAIILAAAGLERLKKTEYIKQYFNDDEMISASGQGTLCIESRKEDTELNMIIKAIEDNKGAIKASIERKFAQIFEGGCTTPMGCNAKIVDNRILFKGMYFYDGVRYDGYVEGYTFEKDAIAYRLANQIKAQYTKDKGKIYLVGAGPGDVDLLTLRAYKLIQSADCILYDRLVGNEILALANKDCELIYVGKENHESGLSQGLINEQMISASFKYKKIVRLKSGDPFIYGRGFEEIQAISLYNIDFEVVPGITAFSAASVCGNIPLTDRYNSSSIHVFSGHGKANTDNLDYNSIAKIDGTIIFYMAIRNIKAIIANLIKCGMDKTKPIAFIENASTIDQRIISATLEDVINSDVVNKVKAPAIVMIGNVVKLRNTMFWPKQSESITLLSTRENKFFTSFEKQAKNYGFNSLSAPQIEIVDVKKDEEINFEMYDLVLFNSANGVRYFAKNYDINAIKNKVIGVVGIKTKEELEKLDCTINIMPKVFNMQELIYESVKEYPRGRILVIGSLKTQFDITTWQRRIDNEIRLLVCYDTISVEYDYFNLIEQVNNSNVLCFFSSSGVKAFMKNLNFKNELLDSKKIASIGPYTTKTLLDFGLKVDIEATVSTQEGLINEIKDYYNI